MALHWMLAAALAAPVSLPDSVTVPPLTATTVESPRPASEPPLHASTDQSPRPISGPPVSATSAEQPPSQAPLAAGAPRDPDFLFGPPRGSLGVRVGRSFARAGGDLFPETRERFTLGERAFDAWTLGLDITLRAEEWYDAAASFTYSRASAPSEYRDWVDNEDLPIEQRTTLSQLGATLGFKVYPTSRGRAVGSLAWVPARFTPYFGVQGGVVRYSFEQVGDFVDFSDSGIYTDELTAGGWTPTGHLLAGVDVGVSARTLLRLEGRYAIAAASGANDFRSYNDLDLSGFQATAGLALRF